MCKLIQPGFSADPGPPRIPMAELNNVGNDAWSCDLPWFDNLSYTRFFQAAHVKYD
jgi:hypothetical protein